jgi:hypothetical protein
MAAAVLLVASAPVLGPLPWFIGQVVGFAAIAWLTGRYAGKLGAS